LRSINGEDTSWVNHYFYNRSISSVYVQNPHVTSSTIVSNIFVSMASPLLLDSTLVYTIHFPVASYWKRNDAGLNRKGIGRIVSFTGFPYSSHGPQSSVFCCANNQYIYVFKDTIWEKTWSGEEIIAINQLFANDSTVFACGTFNGFIPNPVVLISVDYGKTWEEFSPFPNHVANSITASDDSDTIYVALNNMIIKSTDGGINWFDVLQFENTYISSILINPLNPCQIYAGGKIFNNSFVLLQSDNCGNTWRNIPYLWNGWVAGINCMTGRINNNNFEVYIGTNGSGVYKYIPIITNIEKDPKISTAFELYQNYPNPFNPLTTIKYSIPNVGKRHRANAGQVTVSVQLKVYDLLGREVTKLVNEEKTAGNYEVEFDGKYLSSGIYFYNLTAGEYSSSKKMILIK